MIPLLISYDVFLDLKVGRTPAAKKDFISAIEKGHKYQTRLKDFIYNIKINEERELILELCENCK